jgi:serine/threonine protein kinase
MKNGDVPGDLPRMPGTVPDEQNSPSREATVGDTPGLDNSGTAGDPNFPTVDAPSFRAPARGPIFPAPPQPGDRIDDFEIIRVLGSGTFATVYLARQQSLDRQVALKVSVNRGTEARTLASLEHEHIVRIFSETVDRQRDKRLLCMQFVQGTTLAHVIEVLGKRDRQTWSGRAILEAIDELSTGTTAFDPAALRDRELLDNADFVDAVCWIGARLAEALAHAHGQGVLHRDIKPANILLNRYGRPLLADFNIAFDPRPVSGEVRRLFGGTLAYMAPEHIDAFNPAENAPREAVDRRSDIYALGLVLFELLTGRLPGPEVPTGDSTREWLRKLAAVRRAGTPELPPENSIPEVMCRVLRRCLQPNPDDRFQSADELARALEGCREHRQVEKALPPAGWLTRTIFPRPLVGAIILLLLPHILGSALNISYNALRIVERLTPAQQAAFMKVVLGYNAIIYPASMLTMVAVLLPIARDWRRLQSGEWIASTTVRESRRRMLRLPWWTILLSCVGWLPGGLLFPVGISILAENCDTDVFGHFLLSFTIAGLIALTYSVFAVQYVCLRVLYPRWWIDAHDLRRQAQAELADLPRRLKWLQLLAGLIPLTGAMLMVFVGPEEFTSGYRSFRLLVTALIALGMVGFGVAVGLSGLLGQTVTALTSGSGRAASH